MSKYYKPGARSVSGIGVVSTLPVSTEFACCFRLVLEQTLLKKYCKDYRQQFSEF